MLVTYIVVGAIVAVALAMVFVIIKLIQPANTVDVGKHVQTTTEDKELRDEELHAWLTKLHDEEPDLHNLYSGDTVKLPIPPFARDTRSTR